MVGSGGAEISATIKGIGTRNEAQAQSKTLGQITVRLDLVDSLARHADCTGERGLIAVIEPQGVGLADREVLFHG